MVDICDVLRTGCLGRAWQTVIALFAAAFAVVLVPLLCLSMAFVEYQSRLQRYQPSISASEIMDALDREAEFHANIVLQGAMRLQMEEATLALDRAQAEVRFRAERVCSLFPRGNLTDKQLGERYTRCIGFLLLVPYDGTIDPRANAQLDTAALGRDPNWQQFEKVVLANFVAEMTGAGGTDSIAQYLPMMNGDIVRIARRNQEIFMRLRLDRDFPQRALFKACVRALELQMERTYTSGFVPNCANRAGIDFTPFTNPTPAPDKPAAPQPASNGSPTDGGASPNATNGGSDDGPGPGADGDSSTGGSSNPDPNSGGGGQNAAVNPSVLNLQGGGAPAREIVDPQRTEKMRRYELIRQLQMYDWVTVGIAKHLVLTPPDFLAMWLLVVGGALGAMLKILFRHLLPAENVAFADLVLEPAKGLICAVLLFILLRSGFAVVSGTASLTPEGAALSPFFVAFLAVGAGLMSDQVLRAVRSTASAFIGERGRLHPNRWAVGLDAALQMARMTSAQLAERLGLPGPERVEMWRRLQEPVESEYQEKITLLLNVPAYRLFTDMQPPRPASEEPQARGQAGPTMGDPAPA